MLFEFKNCGGCKTCEIACSYRFSGAFNHHMSAVKVVEKRGQAGFAVDINDEQGAVRFACDGCADLEAPMCAEYCHDPEEFVKLIGEFVRLKQGGAG